MSAESGEPIRLIVWDLDETFWRGTLSEGGVSEFVEAHERLVVELARRGIVSSICSRNDPDAARAVLIERNVWDYFIFPSIDWSAKPERVRAIIEAAQLRPQTVMFIDDNASNRAAVAQAIPGIRVAAETFVEEIADHPHFRGKRDDDLTRLKQYKLLEKRSHERAVASDPREFLRASGVRIEIEVDLAPHFERAVELINRTNQLNFTKTRLSEDLTTAVAQLRDSIANAGPWVRAGLIRVRDNYGDYGYCGFYLQIGQRLQHFCFSCRVLGFGVESFVYSLLGRPDIEIKGEVLVDLATAPPVDWITLDRLGEAAPLAPGPDEETPGLSVRGRCEVGLLTSYFRFAGLSLLREGAYTEGLMELYSDSAVNMFFGCGARWPAARRELKRLGFASYAGCSVFSRKQPIMFFSHRDFLTRPFLYRHKHEDFVVCLSLVDYPGDLVESDFARIEAHVRAREPRPERAEAEMARLAHLRESYVSLRATNADIGSLVRRCLRGLRDEAAPDALLMPVLMHAQAKGVDGSINKFVQIEESRRALIETLGDDPRVKFIDASACIFSTDEINDWFHYDRIVYYRMAKAVIEHCRDFMSAQTPRVAAPLG